MKRARPLAFVVIVIAFFCLAPTPGDIGGCGQPPDDLDPTLFFQILDATDCRACQQCGFVTATCSEACNPAAKLPESFPQGCAPLAHDGEVCLRRLQHDSCDDYARYVAADDAGHAVPITSRPRPPECQFCPVP